MYNISLQKRIMLLSLLKIQFSVAKKHIKSLQNGMKLAGIALKRPMKVHYNNNSYNS